MSANGSPKFRAGEPRVAPGQRNPQVGLGFLRGGARPPTEQVVAYVEAHKASFGVEPICEVLEVAPSTYYAARNRQPCARVRRDAELKLEIERVYAHNRFVYGPRKVWRALNREGISISRCRTERLMRQMGIQGRSRARKRRTTIPADVGLRPSDLVNRRFVADRPNQLWVADITYVPTWSGFAYAAFVIDVFARRIVGWRVSSTLRSDLALDALEMAIWSRKHEDLSGVIHHSDRGVQYLCNSLHRAPRRGRRRRLGRLQRRQL